MELGEKIKYFRKQKNLTIKELAVLTGLSSGFISNLERNINSPSLSNLQHICEVLDINIVELIQSSVEDSPIVRKSERTEFFKTDNDKVRFELITDGKKELNAICITVEPNSEYGDSSWGHNYDEIGLVTKGVLNLTINNKEYVLREGDSIYIKKFTPHSYHNSHYETCITYWFSVKN